MSLATFRAALVSKLGETVTPELCAWLEAHAFDSYDLAIDISQFEPKSYRGLTFSAERIADIEVEIHPLHQAHWTETERARHGIPMNPDYEGFKAAERRGTLLQFTARRDSVLVGNIRFYIYDDMHTQTKGAHEDTFFLAPPERKGFAAIRFWKYAEDCLASIGVQEIRTDSKVIYDAQGQIDRNVGRLNEYLGYQHASNGYIKRLKVNSGRK
jgi:hypothetical protein